MSQRLSCMECFVGGLRDFLWPTSVFFRECRNYFLLLCAVVFLVLLPILCHDLQDSAYYRLFADEKELDRLLRLENNQRIEMAKDFLRHYKRKNGTGILNSGVILVNPDVRQGNHTGQSVVAVSDYKPRVVIVIPTVSREKILAGDVYSPKYLTQVTTRLLHLVSRLDASLYPLNVGLVICNVDSNKAKIHAEAKVLSDYVTVWDVPLKVKNTAYANKYERLKWNYVYCLNRTQVSLDPDFSLAIQDDALPNDDFFMVLRSMIETYFLERNDLESSHYSMDRVRKLNHPGVMKFYHPTRLVGFLALDAERLPELFSMGLVLSGAALLAHYGLYRRHRKDIELNIHTLWSVLFVICTLACFLVGRVNLISFHRLFSPHLYYVTPAPSCCAQANLYPRHQIAPLLDFLGHVHCNSSVSLDGALDMFMSLPESRGYLVQPNVFRHIGIYSAHKQRKLSSLMGW